jgi:hypothetical protein
VAPRFDRDVDPFLSMILIKPEEKLFSIHALPSVSVHALDQLLVLLIHEFAFQLHRRRQLIVFCRKLVLDQAKFLDGLDPRESLVYFLDLRPD